MYSLSLPHHSLSFFIFLGAACISPHPSIYGVHIIPRVVMSVVVLVKRMCLHLFSKLLSLIGRIIFIYQGVVIHPMIEKQKNYS